MSPVRSNEDKNFYRTQIFQKIYEKSQNRLNLGTANFDSSDLGF